MRSEILIVNKSREEQKAIKQVLNSLNFNFTFASQGSEALLLAKRIKPALIISQVSDADMDGITMADIIRKDKSLRDTPIVFIHEELDMRLIAAAKQVDSKAFLIKPYINNALIYAVKKVLEASEEVVPVEMSRFQARNYVYA